MSNSQSKIKWYAVYTKSRNEKKVEQRLTNEGIECFLPLHKRLKQWSDRKKTVYEPLFTSYIFVRIDERFLIPVLETPGVVRFIRFNGKLQPIPDWQIELVKKIISTDQEFELSQTTFKKGTMVEVTSGPLKGISGTVVELKGKYKLVISIDAINQNLLVTVSNSQLDNVYL